ncbi:unnamed protein product [Closterium sp. NIES-53]
MLLRLSIAARRVPLPSPPASSLPALADPESDSLRAASPTVTRLLSTVVTGPSFESAAASALVTKLVDFAAHCRLDYAANLVAESESVCPPSVGGECTLGTDVLEDRQEEFECFAAAVPHLVSMLIAPEGDPDAPDIPTPRSYAEAIAGEYSSQWQSAMDAEMASWKSIGTYFDEVPPPGANIVSGMWIFRVKRPPGSPPVFKARYVARGFSQREGVDFFQTFSPILKMTILRVLLHVAAQRDYELHSLDFSTAFLQGCLHEEIWLRRPPGFTRSTTLAALGFSSSTADPSLFLRTDTSMPPFYILVYVDDLVFATADTEALAHVKSELQKRHTSFTKALQSCDDQRFCNMLACFSLVYLTGLRTSQLELLALELEALALVALELDERELETLELLTLELEVLELGVLCLVVLVLEALCGCDCTSFPCFSSRSRRYSQPPHCLLLLLTLSRLKVLQSVVSLSLFQPLLFALFALVVGFLVHSSSFPRHPRYGTSSFLCSTACSSESSLPTIPDPDRLDYATALVAESEFASPPSIESECALGTDVLEDMQEDIECLAPAVPHLMAMLLATEGDPDAPDILTPRSYVEAITGPYSSQWQIAMDTEMASWKSTSTYGEAAVKFSACPQGAWSQDP